MCRLPGCNLVALRCMRCNIGATQAAALAGGSCARTHRAKPAATGSAEPREQQRAGGRELEAICCGGVCVRRGCGSVAPRLPRGLSATPRNRRALSCRRGGNAASVRTAAPTRFIAAVAGTDVCSACARRGAACAGCDVHQSSFEVTALPAAPCAARTGLCCPRRASASHSCTRSTAGVVLQAAVRAERQCRRAGQGGHGEAQGVEADQRSAERRPRRLERRRAGLVGPKLNRRFGFVCLFASSAARARPQLPQLR